MSCRFRVVPCALLLIASGISISPVKAADTWAGKYAGRNGSYSWKVTLTSKGTGTYSLHETVGSRMPECAGELETNAKLVGDKLVVNDSDCSLTIAKRVANGIKIAEKQCNTWHGAACEFSADLARK